jgi:hypothetical protein
MIKKYETDYMNDEQWNELLELREKASLSPRTDYRFQSLEIYLSSLYILSLYSPEEKEKFNTQFKALSDEDRQALSHRVTKKTLPNFFHLTQEEMEKLQAMRKDLSLHERARLLSNLILTATGTAWLDLGEVFEAQIEIDDNSSPERWSRPYAYISFSNGSNRQVETVDIIASVNNNPAAIGHPAIVFAIHHWQRVIHAKRVIERDDITSRDETWKSFRQAFSGEMEVEVAERNLAAIGGKLLRGAKKGAISKEAALAIKVELLGIRLEDTNTVFYRAWERLGAEFIDPLDEVHQTLEKLKADLLTFEKQPHTEIKSRRISADRVMMFLHEEGAKGGKKFIGYNEDGISLRQSWKVFRNAFAAWFFDLEQSVVQDYLEKAAKENVDSDDVYQYSWTSPRTLVSRIFHYLLSGQLVMARQPVTISEAIIGVHGLDKAIEDANSEATEEGRGN